MKKVGLVLEGGAMRGMYTAGVLDVFLDNNIKIDGIIGVSAGAIVGINYFSKQRGRTIRYNKKYVKDKRYISFSSLIKTGNIINKDFAYYKIPFKLDKFDEKMYQKSKGDFYCTVTNVDTGLAEYIKITNTKKQMEVIRATSAMPFLSKMIKINNQMYLDGALADSIPIKKCMELGFDKIIVVLTRPINYRKKKPIKFFGKIIYRKYPNLVTSMNNRYLNYNKTLKFIEECENKNEIIVIRPSVPIKIKRLEKNPDKLDEVYQLGISDAKKNIKRIKNYIKTC